MKSIKRSERKTPTVEVDSSGKKLVQARLSFKTISSTSSNNADTPILNRKRKLSYSEDDKITAPKIGRLSESKENVPITGVDSSSLVSISDDEDANNVNAHQSDTWSPIVKLQNCDHLVTESLKDSPKTEETNKKFKKDHKKPAKITIKLPLGNKKKRKLPKKVLNLDENKETDDNDVEIISNKSEISLKKHEHLDNEEVPAVSQDNNNKVGNKILSPKEGVKPIDNLNDSKEAKTSKDEKSGNEKKDNIMAWLTSGSKSKNLKPSTSNNIEQFDICEVEISENDKKEASVKSENSKQGENTPIPKKKDSPSAVTQKAKGRPKGSKNKATPKNSERERTKTTINPVKRSLGEKLEDPDVISTDDDEILSEKEEQELLNSKSKISEGKNDSKVKTVINGEERKTVVEISKDDTPAKKTSTKSKSEGRKSQEDLKKTENVKTPKVKAFTDKASNNDVKMPENKESMPEPKTTGQKSVPQESNDLELISSDDDKLSDDEKTNGKNSKDEKEKINNATPKSASKAPLTPKPLSRRKESEARRAEREKLKEEKEKMLEEKKKEKDEKERQRIREKEEKEEQRKKEKEEKEEQRKKEKEDKEKKRLAEIEAKSEEKRQKEDERKKREEAKEEEKRKREEERKEKELEAELKKKKASEAFTKFFVKKNKDNKKIEDDQQNSVDSDVNMTHIKFMPFQVKGHMNLAPLCRRMLEEKEKLRLEEILTEVAEIPKEELYIQNIRNGKIYPRKYVRTEINDDSRSVQDDDASDVVIVEDELEGAGQSIDDAPKQTFRAKYLLFNENKRPAYYGTWRKKSKIIKSRRPFATDTVFFDYEVDSDDEWEEEEPGESLHGSDDEKESEDEYEVDNDFFVPHGHLSDEELQNEDEEDDDNTPETQKAKLKILQQEFAQEMKKKTEKIKPRLVGIIWTDENGNQPEECPDIIWKSLEKREMMFGTEPISMIPPATNSSTNDSPTQEKKSNNKQSKLNEELVKDLIQLVHGNRHKKQFLILEFQAFIGKKITTDPSLGEYTNVSIKNKIEKISEFKILRNNGAKKAKMCWIVQEEILKKYDLEDLSLINKWVYNLEPKKRHIDDGKEEEKMIAESEADLQQLQNEQKSHQDLMIVQNIKTDNSRPSSPAITKFTKVLSKENKKQQFVSSSKDKSSILKETGSKIVNQMKSDQTLLPSTSNSKTIADKSVTSSPSTVLPKKRVALLMSVPRGQQFPQSTKNALISNFLKKSENKPKQEEKEDMVADVVNIETDSSAVNSKSNKNKNQPSAATPMEIDEVVVIE